MLQISKNTCSSEKWYSCFDSYTIAILLNLTDMEGEGYVHMVVSKPSCHGIGIDTYMALLAVYVLKKEVYENTLPFNCCIVKHAML